VPSAGFDPALLGGLDLGGAGATTTSARRRGRLMRHFLCRHGGGAGIGAEMDAYMIAATTRTQ